MILMNTFLRKALYRAVNFLWLFIFLSVAPSGVIAGEVVDRIVAVVNDEIITYTMLNEAFAPYDKKIKEQNYPFAKEMEVRFRFREKLIGQLVEQKLTEQEVKTLGIEISEKEIDAAIERTKSSNNINDEQLRGMLEKDGLTVEMYRKNMRQQLLKTRLIQYEVKSKIVITNIEIEDYYKKNKSEFEEKKLEEVETAIHNKLYQTQVQVMFEKWLKDLRKNAHVKIIQ